MTNLIEETTSVSAWSCDLRLRAGQEGCAGQQEGAVTAALVTLGCLPILHKTKGSTPLGPKWALPTG